MKNYSRLFDSLRTEPKLTYLAIDFFTCRYYQNSTLFKDILEVFEEKYNKPIDSHNLFWVRGGRLSIDDFQYYVQTRKILGDRFPMGISEAVVEALLKEFVIIKMNPSFTQTNNILYFPNVEYVDKLRDNNLLDNLIFGYNYIIEKYKSSVALIEIYYKIGDVSVGTGFLISYEETEIVVTNKHVVEDASKIIVWLNGQVINHNNIIKSENSDIAFILIADDIDSHSFFLNKEMDVLREIITIGYPSIPMTRDAYQVCHKGEVNSFVQDYNGDELFLISAKTTSGNSGSPVIDKHGSVIGMITKELFEEEALLKKGKLPYYASIPSSKIQSELKLLVKNN